MAILYARPEHWIRYDAVALAPALVEAKAAMLALTALPYQRNWADSLQAVQLKREVAGTSRIEGAEFTEEELAAALDRESLGGLATRSQRQAAAAKRAYEWIEQQDPERPVDEQLIREIHVRIVREADDDHCTPGALRTGGENVVFGSPPHRGAEGGEECQHVFTALCQALRETFIGHDPLVQALALHYHLAAIHPFADGNGRTARAVEALMLRRAGLRGSLFIAMSNYYYDEKAGYLAALAEVRQRQHDLTPFLRFALAGVTAQCRRLAAEITLHLRKALFRNVMFDLFGHLKTPKKRVIAERQLAILKQLLGEDLLWSQLAQRMQPQYADLKAGLPALIRDLNGLLHLGAIRYERVGDDYRFFVRLEWPTEIAESEFFKRLRELPQAKTHRFLGSD